MEQQTYYIIIPAPAFNDEDLSDKDKLLTGLINSLLDENGCCFASNEYLAKKMKTTPETISRRLNKLKIKGYIEIIYIKKGNIVVNRKIYPIPPLTKMSTTDDKNINGTVDENVKDSNKVISNIKENNITKVILKENFKKPTIEELEIYKNEINLKYVDCNKFYDYYESNGWKVGKNSMKDWEATMRNWNRNNKSKDKISLDEKYKDW